MAYEIAMSEIYVPYGDPDRTGAGAPRSMWASTPWAISPSPLTAGLDVPEGARFLSEVVAGDTGSEGGTWKAVRATAISERADGAIWSRGNRPPSSAMRGQRAQLVFCAGVRNRPLFLRGQYAFGQDGAIDIRVRAQGSVLAKGVAEGSDHRRRDPPGRDRQRS